MNETLFLLLHGHTARVWLVGGLVALSVADFITTRLALRREGLKEGNPLVARLLSRFGIDALGLVKLALVAGLLLFGTYVDNRILLALNIIYLIVAANNYRLYKNAKG